VRYDTAHGRPHKDILHPDGTQDKVEFYGYSRLVNPRLTTRPSLPLATA